MVDVKCMTVVLISACVYDTVLRGGTGREPESVFRCQRSFLVLFWGNAVSLLVALSVHLFVNALALQLPALLVASLVVRWLLYNVHSLSLSFLICVIVTVVFVLKYNPKRR